MLNNTWMKKEFNRLMGTTRPSRKQCKLAREGRKLRIETFEPRMMLSVTTHPDATNHSAVLADQTTGFLQVDNSADIDLAQTDQVFVGNIGAATPSAQSPIHYASSSGGGDGSQNSPWSLAQANSQLQPGETLYLTEGEYLGSIDPNASGNSNNPIRITAAPGLSVGQVHVRGPVGGSQRTPAVNIRSGRNHIIIEGFTVSLKDGLQANQDGNNITVDGNNITVRNMHILHDAAAAEGPFAPNANGLQVTHRDHIKQVRLSGRPQENGISSRGSRVLIEGNLIEHMYIGVVVPTKSGKILNVVRGNSIVDPVHDGIHLGGSDSSTLVRGHLIENNVITGAMVSDGITFDAGLVRKDANGNVISTDPVINGVVVRNNAIFNIGENTIDLKGTKNIVIEGNYLWGSFGDNDGSGIHDRPDCTGSA